MARRHGHAHGGSVTAGISAGHTVCRSGKRSWARKKDAKLALRRYQSHATCSVCRVYECPECGEYHLTSVRRWEPAVA